MVAQDSRIVAQNTRPMSGEARREQVRARMQRLYKLYQKDFEILEPHDRGEAPTQRAVSA